MNLVVSREGGAGRSGRFSHCDPAPMGVPKAEHASGACQIPESFWSFQGPPDGAWSCQVPANTPVGINSAPSLANRADRGFSGGSQPIPRGWDACFLVKCGTRLF